MDEEIDASDPVCSIKSHCGEELLSKRFACKKYSIKDQLKNLHRPHFDRKDLIADKCLLPKTSYNEATHTFESIPTKYGIFPMTQLVRLRNNLKTEPTHSSNHDSRTQMNSNISEINNNNLKNLNNINSQQILSECKNEINEENFCFNERKSSDEKMFEIKISSDAESSSSQKNKSFASNKTFSIEYPTNFETFDDDERNVHLPEISSDCKSKRINIECVELRLPIRKETVIKIFSDNSIQIKPSNTHHDVSEIIKTIELNFKPEKDSQDKIQILNIIFRNSDFISK